MATNDRLLIAQLDVSIRSLERSMKKAGIHVDQASDRMEKRWERMNRRVTQRSNQMASDVRRAIAGVAIGLASREVIGYADAWTEAGNKIAAAGTPLEQQTARLKELSNTAIETRSSFDATAALYARLGIATENLTGKSYDLLKVTELINKATVAGGASTAERNSTVLQLSQALASGQLMGEELRALRENAPLLMQALAAEFDTTIGKLKDLGAEGKLTAERVLDAILAAEGDIEDRFSKTNVTIGDSFTNLRTRITEYIGIADDGVSMSEKIAGSINFVADNIDAFAEALIVAGAALTGALGAQAAATVVTGLASIAKGATLTTRALTILRASALTALGPLGIVVGSVAAAWAYMALNAEDAGEATAQYVTQAESLNGALDKYVQAQALANGLSGEAKENAEALAQAARNEAREILNSADAKIADARAIIERAKAAREAARSDPTVMGRGSGPLEMRPRTNQTLIAESDRAIEQQISNIEALESAVQSARDTLSQDPASISLPEVSGGPSVASSAGRDKDREEAIRTLESIRDAYRQTFETEREEIRRTLAEQLEAIDKAKASEQEKAQARRWATATAKARIKEVSEAEAEAAAEAKERQKEQADREISLLQQVEAARDQMAGRAFDLLAREYDQREAYIRQEIEDETRKQEALAALAEERRLAEADLEKRALGEGRYASNPIEQIRARQEEELALLEEWYEEKLDREAEYLERRKEINDEAEAEITAIKQQAAIDQFEAAANGLDAAADLAKKFAGENKGITKALFLAEKAAALGSAYVQMNLAIAKAAAAAPPPANVPLIAAAKATGMATIAGIAASTIAGFEKGGYTGNGGPKDIAGVVHGQEFVLNKPATDKYRSIAESMNRGDFESRISNMIQPVTLNPAVLAGGNRTINVAGSSLVFNGPVDSGTAAQFSSMLDQRDREMMDRFEAAMESYEKRTTPRHERSRFWGG